MNDVITRTVALLVLGTAIVFVAIALGHPTDIPHDDVHPAAIEQPAPHAPHGSGAPHDHAEPSGPLHEEQP